MTLPYLAPFNPGQLDKLQVALSLIVAWQQLDAIILK